MQQNFLEFYKKWKVEFEGLKTKDNKDDDAVKLFIEEHMEDYVCKEAYYHVFIT